MTRRYLNIAEMERRATEPSFNRKPARAHRGVKQRVSRDGRRTSEPNVVPTERDRRNFDMLSPDEVAVGYQVKWAEALREPLEAD